MQSKLQAVRKLTNALCRELKFPSHYVEPLKEEIDEKCTLFGIYFRPKRIVFLRMRSKKTNAPYANKFLLSILVHELAHFNAMNHTKKHVKEMRKIRTNLKKLLRDEKYGTLR